MPRNRHVPDLRIHFEEMTKGPFAYLKRVPEEGYHWDDAFEELKWLNEREDRRMVDPGPWLVGPTPVGTAWPAHQYPPLSKPNLHRRFAQLQPSCDGTRPSLDAIKRFASEFGDLGHGQALAYPGRSGKVQVGDSLSYWLNEIAAMSRLLTVWDLVQNRRVGRLGQLIVWSQAPTQVLFRWETQFEKHFHLIAHSEMAGKGGDELLARWRVGDVLDPATYYVHDAINRAMRGHVSPAVLPFREGDIYIFPDCLLSAMYVLFALEVSGKMRPAIACKGCGRLFIPEHGHQKYHNEACRKLVWYRNQPRPEKEVQ